MIPILYDAKEYDFDNNGIGRLADCASCVVTEEKNGMYECEIVYPMSGQFYSELSLDRIVKVKANEMSDYQLFRIYRITKPLNGLTKLYCQHISYDLNGVVVNPVLASSQYQGEEVPFEVRSATPQFVINRLLEMSVYPDGFSNRFTISATSATAKDFSLSEPQALRTCLGGDDQSVLATYGGEFEFDNFHIYLKEARGQDTGVTILYGKNLTDINVETNITETYTALFPYAIDEDNELYTLSTNNGLVLTDNVDNFGEPRILPVNLTDQFDLEEEDITEERLAELAAEYITSNKITDIYQNIEISFAQLWQTSEYKNIAMLERVGLCDIVTVKYSKLGVSAKAKVIKTVYDCLKEKYDSIELGEAKATIGETLIKQRKKLEKVVEESATKSDLQLAIENATSRITGQEGGYIVFNDHTSGTFYDGTPYNITSSDSGGRITEMLVMDTPDINTARKIWRYNLAGWGYSSNGYMGPFALAATADGAIVGDRITVGKINAGLIKTGIIEDEQHTNYWNMNTGEFRLSASTKVGTSASNQTLSNYVNSAAAGTLTQQNVFNALTSNGALQGIFMSGGDLYINGTYINSGAINANLITTGTINADLIRAGTIASTNGRTTISMSTGDISVAMNSGAKMGIGVLGMSIYDSNNNVVSRYGLNTSHYGTGNNSGKYSTFDYEYLSFDNGYSHVQIAPTSNYSGISISKLVSSDVSATNISGTTAEYKHFSVTDSNSSEIGSFQKITVTSSGVSSEKSKITSDQGEITELTATKISSVSELNGHPLQRILQTVGGVSYYVWGYQAT